MFFPVNLINVCLRVVSARLNRAGILIIKLKVRIADLYLVHVENRSFRHGQKEKTKQGFAL